jgi:RNA polymerase sigma-70 factor (ECF subfamily)
VFFPGASHIEWAKGNPAMTDPPPSLAGDNSDASGPPSPHLTSASDASLVAAIHRRDEAALAEAYRRHAGAVFGLARRVVSDATLAEEVVQEVFLRLWNAPEKFDPDRGALKTFLMTTTHGRSIDIVRSETARRNREARDFRRTTRPGTDVQEEVIELSVVDQVHRAIGKLPDRQREAIELAHLRGHTYQEVAAILGQPEGTVKSRIRAGLKRLRDELELAGAGSLL